MNEQLSIQMKQPLHIAYQNTEQTRSRPQATTNIALFQQLKEVRKELKKVKKERDSLKKEVLNTYRII
jgi:hypothetical protein